MNTNTNIDYLGNGTTQGPLANYMAQQGRMDPGAMRPFIGKDGKPYVTLYKGGPVDKPESYKTMTAVDTYATLRRDEWKQLDEALLMISEYRLGGVDDLIASGLVYNLGNAMGTTVLEYHDVSDALTAELTMDGVTRAPGDRQEFGTHYLPIPIIHADYEINARALAASRNLGNALDVGMAERAGRKVKEKLENMLFTADPYSFGEGTIYAYVDHPDRNQVTLTENWDAAGKTGAEIIADVLDMKKDSIAHYHFGPWKLYIPTAYETKLDEDYSTAKGTNTIRERILQISGITGIKVIDTLSANNVLLVQMTSDVVRLVQGMPLTNIEWTVEGKFITKYKVLTIAVPQIRSDQDGNSGVTHLASA